MCLSNRKSIDRKDCSLPECILRSLRGLYIKEENRCTLKLLLLVNLKFSVRANSVNKIGRCQQTRNNTEESSTSGATVTRRCGLLTSGEEKVNCEESRQKLKENQEKQDLYCRGFKLYQLSFFLSVTVFFRNCKKNTSMILLIFYGQSKE